MDDNDEPLPRKRELAGQLLHELFTRSANDRITVHDAIEPVKGARSATGQCAAWPLRSSARSRSARGRPQGSGRSRWRCEQGGGVPG